jgi:hypothetical protein
MTVRAPMRGKMSIFCRNKSAADRRQISVSGAGAASEVYASTLPMAAAANPRSILGGRSADDVLPLQAQTGR